MATPKAGHQEKKRKWPVESLAQCVASSGGTVAVGIVIIFISDLICVSEAELSQRHPL